MDTRKVVLGGLLLIVSSLILLQSDTIAATMPTAVTGVVAIGMAGGALLLGTSDPNSI
ncbi:MAG: hypothetical protein SVG88_01425 [Halobacteriales archaeon]|nr:hypothetical protein [Halobacteriales archaeon]